MSLAWAFFKRDAVIAMSYRTSFTVTMLGNLVILVVCYYIGEMLGEQEIPALQRYGGSYLAFLLIGIALTDSVGISLTTFANQIREGQTTGSLEATLMSPVSLPIILVYSSLWSYFLSAFRFALYLILGMAFYGFAMDKADLGAAVVIFLLTVVAFAGFGMIWASIVMLVKRGDSIMSLAGALMVLLSGVLFPVSVLPGWLEGVAQFVLPADKSVAGVWIVCGLLNQSSPPTQDDSSHADPRGVARRHSREELRLSPHEPSSSAAKRPGAVQLPGLSDYHRV